MNANRTSKSRHRNRYAAPWKYTLGDESNPYNGVVHAASGELLLRRATMNEKDEAAMRLIAAAPELLAALEEYADQFGETLTAREVLRKLGR